MTNEPFTSNQLFIVNSNYLVNRARQEVRLYLELLVSQKNHLSQEHH